MIGIGVTLWRYSNNYSSVFALAALLFLPLYLPNPLQTLWQAMTLLQFNRFMLLTSPFVAFSMASGVFFFYNFLKTKQVKSLYSSLLIVILLMIFIIPPLAYNNPEVSSNTDRKYFTSEELDGLSYVLKYVPNNSSLYSDYYIKRYFCQKEFNDSDKLGFPFYNAQTIRSIDIVNSNGYFILNNEAFSERGLNLDPSSRFYLTKDDLSEWKKLNLELSKKNKIYSSTYISIFYT